MSNYSKLLTYIEYFEDPKFGLDYRREEMMMIADGSHQLDPLVYDREMYSFEKDFQESGCLDSHYLTTLRSAGIYGKKIYFANIETANFELLRAILSFFMDVENLCEGVWIVAQGQKIFLRILKRLDELKLVN